MEANKRSRNGGQDPRPQPAFLRTCWTMLLLCTLFLLVPPLSAEDLDNDGRPDDLQLAMGRCASFDGGAYIGNNIDLACLFGSGAYFVNYDWSVDFWIRFDQINSGETLVAFGAPGLGGVNNDHFSIERWNGNGLAVKWEGENSNYTQHYVPNFFQEGVWQHVDVRLVWVGHTLVEIYRNGQLLLQNNATSANGGEAGYLQVASGQPFFGQIDELRITSHYPDRVMYFDFEDGPHNFFNTAGDTCPNGFLARVQEAWPIPGQLDCDGNGRIDMHESDCGDGYLPDCDTGASGLLASYFPNTSMQDRAVMRLEGPIDHEAIGGNLIQGIPRNFISARYQGQVRLPGAGPVTFWTVVADGCRLHVDGETLIDAWVVSNQVQWHAGVYSPDPGEEWVPIQLDYLQNTGTGKLQLMWQHSGMQGAELIPASELRYLPAQDCNGNEIHDDCETDLLAATNLDIELLDAQQLLLTWDPVPCATRYRVTQIDATDAENDLTVTSDTLWTIDISAEPANSIMRYRLRAMILD